MQLVRLVDPGIPDKMIVFDELPKAMLREAEQIAPRDLGLPRHWDVLGTQYALYYKTINKHKMAWEEICGFVPRNVSRDLRLRDDLSAMAVPASSSSNEGIKIEPEDIPVIKILKADSPVQDKKEVEAVNVEPVVSQGEKTAHAKNCISLGRGLKYTAGCARCDQLSGKLVTA
jgi:hypothetical protein